MSCFSWAWLEQMLIWLVIVLVIVAIFKLVVPAMMAAFGSPPGGGIIVTILGYILWAVVAIFAIIVVFDLIQCAIGGGGLGLPALRR